MVPNFTNRCWNSLLLLAQNLKKYPSSVHYCRLQFGSVIQVSINDDSNVHSISDEAYLVLNPKRFLPREDIPFFQIRSLTHVSEIGELPLSPSIKKFIRLYSPYCFFPLYARRRKRAISVSHFAQTLDGRIATHTGNSKWIGNSLNRTHAHRMRALCDGVLIGHKTLLKDTPQLTVRHVRGDSPVRVVVGSNFAELPSRFIPDASRVILIGNKFPRTDEDVHIIEIPSKSGHISTGMILEELYKLGILSVYIEGGAVTSSRFLQERCIDVIQIHISPLLFGSGISSFSLPNIENVEQSISFQYEEFVSMGNGVMFVGEVRRKGSG